MPELSAQGVVGMAQILLKEKLVASSALTRADIEEAVDFAMRGLPKPAVRAEAIRELEARYHIVIGESKTLGDDTDHVPWLPVRRAEIEWRYWARYRALVEERLPLTGVESLDLITDDILGRLEDPRRSNAWSRRGLVVGHVQSGKTANYTGLICKAADAGYKVIVVLAGMHKNLRSQTQIRLDEGFLGYKSSAPTRAAEALTPVGVGLLDPSLKADTITHRGDNGDFKKSVAQNFSISPGGKPLLFVVKKNGMVLKHLLEWVAYAADSKDAATNRPIVRGVPLLVVDDEADHGSVDTKELLLDEDGRPDPAHDPVVINQRIRRLLYCFEQNAYVGYTATPFANIYIHEAATTREYGEDLFPRSFIMNIPAPSNYVGPLRLFGAQDGVEDGATRLDGLPLVRYIRDNARSSDDEETDGWMPPVHNKYHRPQYEGEDVLPSSLREAMKAFVLGCAARRARGQAQAHKTMLIHATRFTDVQAVVYSQVVRELSNLKARLRNGDGRAPESLLSQLEGMWKSDFVATSAAMPDDDTTQVSHLTWEQVRGELWDAISAIEVKQINGTARDVADYDENKATGLNVIVIGGDKLSRGLTLEGLMVSYFLRASRMYDTLMQMGRWFGYRPGYLDLCRLYVTPDLREWFEHIAEASEELRIEFDHMVAVGATPRDYGLKVQSHPILLITSAVKSRHGRELQIDFEGGIAETVVFDPKQSSRQANLGAVNRLLSGLGEPIERDPVRPWHASWRRTYVWTAANGDAVAAFLDEYKTHQSAYMVNGRLLAEFVRRQMEAGELTTWWVVLLGGGDGRVPWDFASCSVQCLQRTARDHSPEDIRKKYRIRRLLSPKDEAIDLTSEEYARALDRTREEWTRDPARSMRDEAPEVPNGPNIRRQRPKERGLLLIYPLDPPTVLEGSDPVIGIGVSMPGSATGRKVTYKVNNVYWVQEYGGES